MFSGGIGSWAAAKRVAEQYGTDDLFLVFADVKGDTDNPHIGEDEDTYRFIEDAAIDVGGELVTVKDGRNIWEVFRDDRFLGNSRLANCSKFLKQKPSREWLEANCSPEDTVVYVGIDWTETHRLPSIEKAYLPYTAKAPLTDPPYLDKEAMIEWAKAEGLKPPRAYELGWPHNNCGGGCVRAGQGQFKMLLEQNPERYAVWEEKEQELRDYLGKDVTILRDRGKAAIDEYVARENPEKRPTIVPLTLKMFRERVEAQNEEQELCLFEIDEDDIGGCGCFVE